MTDIPDETLILRCRAGADDPLETLFLRYDRMLRAKARRLLPAAVRAKVSVSDVMQEARIAAHAHCREFEPQGAGSVRAWLAKIVERKALEAARRHGRTAKRDVGRESRPASRSSSAIFRGRGPSPSEAAIGAEVREAVERALASLPDEQREVLRLTRNGGMTFAEIGACLGRSAEAVRKLHARALVRFSERLAREPGGRRGGG